MESMRECCERIVYHKFPVKNGIIQGTIEGVYKDDFDKYVKFFTGVKWAYWDKGSDMTCIYIHFKNGTEIKWYVWDKTYRHWDTWLWLRL